MDRRLFFLLRDPRDRREFVRAAAFMLALAQVSNADWDNHSRVRRVFEKLVRERSDDRSAATDIQ